MSNEEFPKVCLDYRGYNVPVYYNQGVDEWVLDTRVAGLFYVKCNDEIYACSLNHMLLEFKELVDEDLEYRQSLGQIV